jgi:hypothetical protein
MLSKDTVENAAQLSGIGNVVPEGYSYYEKIIEPKETLQLSKVFLKWYDLRPLDVEITEEQFAESRDFITKEVERLRLDGALGFVILHRAGSVLLLMLMTWRNTNEIWETAYFKDLSQPGSYQVIPADNDQRGTFCVWELGAVWHERNAWVRFLSSSRDEAAKQAYMQDHFSGMV